MGSIYDCSERRPISFLAQMPSVNPGELRLGHALGSMGHAFETEICAVGENSGKQGVFVFDRLAGAQIGKGMRRPCATADFVQDLGDADTRHQPVEGSVQTLGFRQRGRLRRRYMKSAIAKNDPLQPSML